MTFFREFYDEFITLILNYVPQKQLLSARLVYGNWNHRKCRIKANNVWLEMFKRKFPKRKYKKVPWYVYYVLFTKDFFDTNLMEKLGIDCWIATRNAGDYWIVEKNPLPENIEEYNRETRRIATYYHNGIENEVIYFEKVPIYKKILTKLSPAIYVDWRMRARFNCRSSCKIDVTVMYDKWTDPEWDKVKILIKNAPDDLYHSSFVHNIGRRLEISFMQQNGEDCSERTILKKEFPRGLKMEESTTNGLYFNEKYIPEEILTVILSHVPPKQLLNACLVCKNWNDKIKGNSVWLEMFKRKFPKRKYKKLPWYVYYVLFATDFFDTNFIKNANGQRGMDNWFVTQNAGDGWIVEKTPQGAPLLPENVEEFNGETGCFATSFHNCSKQQVICFEKVPIYKKILTELRPAIYVSEWTTARFDCGSSYKMHVTLMADHANEMVYREKRTFDQWSDPKWEKVEIIIKDYPDDLNILIFEHKGKDRQFWKGHFGSKMAGAVIKILFDTIQPKE